MFFISQMRDDGNASALKGVLKAGCDGARIFSLMEIGRGKRHHVLGAQQ